MKHIKKYLGCLLSALMIVSSINIGIATDTIVYTEELETEESNIYFEDLEQSDKTLNLEENVTQNNNSNLTENEETETVNSNISLEEINAISSEINDIIPYSNDVWTYSYTRTVQEFIAPYTGKYYLEVCGATGGKTNLYDKLGGFSGKSSGYINLYEGNKLYIVVGSQGLVSSATSSVSGGYNGGGSASNGAGSGGGATSITTTNRGELKNFEEHKDEIIIVAGGGAGMGSNQHNKTTIGNGGGYVGTTTSTTGIPGKGEGGTQTFGYAFGQGQNSCPTIDFSSQSGYGGAGGGGYFGGYASTDSILGGGGGSGYISKNIYDEQCTTSGNSQSGNGYATIKYIEELSSSLIIDTNNGGTYNNQDGIITITNSVGTIINLPELTPKNGYIFDGYEIISGIDTLNDTYTFDFSDVYLKAKWIAPLTIKTKIDNSLYENRGGLSINCYEEDDYLKKYIIYQSQDKENWYNAYFGINNRDENSLVRTFNYTGNVQTFTAPSTGTYLLEVYGAQGGSGGCGGYSKGYIELQKDETIYVCVGGTGQSYVNNLYITPKGGYNGGGDGGLASRFGNAIIYNSGGGGGGATSITTTNRGELKNFASYKNEVLIVAGGGGGCGIHGTSGAGGGSNGQNGSTYNGSISYGGTQTSGYAFGQGQNGVTPNQYGDYGAEGRGGGGGGWYGGYAIQILSGWGSTGGGAGGSGYIGGVNNGNMIIGNNAGNGKAIITLSEQEITNGIANDIGANDIEKPNTPSNGFISIQNNNFVVNWKNNGDNGTTYYHKAISYNAETGEKLQDSNITEDLIVSGIKGYYYYVDTNSIGMATTSNSFADSNSVIISKPTTKSYIHIAAIDNAGNISDTYNFEIPSVANYTVKHYKMDLNGSYVLDEIVTNSETIGVNVTPEVKTYEGFTSPQSITKTVLADNSTVIEYYYERNKYPVIYIDKDSDGNKLGRTTKQVYYESNVRGADIGSDTTDNAYYNQYRYVSDTSTTVTTSGVTVYRIFEFCKTEATSNLQWNDNNDSDGFRPDKYKLKLKQNGVIIDEAELPSDITNHTFPNLPKYDVNGDPYQYTFDVDATERYEINFDDAGNLIVEDYQPAHFSVTIPKKITLNGNTGKASYTVSVNGTFYYNDTLTVKPENNFILTDRSKISSMQANVTQVKTGFTKEDLPSSINGNISANRTYFSGSWQGTFNFEIKFKMQN